MIYALIACVASAAGMARAPLWAPAVIALVGFFVMIFAAGELSARLVSIILLLVVAYAVYGIGWLMRYAGDRYYGRT